MVPVDKLQVAVVLVPVVGSKSGLVSFVDVDTGLEAESKELG